MIIGEGEVYQKEYNVSQVESIAKDLNAKIKDFNIILFVGDLGAGKTTLIKALMKIWKVEEEVTSPTFSIVNEYKDIEGEPIYHMDLYRLNNIEEAIEIGIEEMLDSENKCIIEWPEKAIPFLHEKYACIEIKHLDEACRNVTMFIRN